MKTFLAVFPGTPAAMERWNALPGQERQSRGVRGSVEVMEVLPIPPR